MRTKHFLLIITVLSCIILSEGLKTNALQTHPIEDEQCTPDLFHIGTFYLTINVSQTEFIPANFTVQESATVNLTVTSIDIGHSFEIPEYNINETIVANTSINVVFEADQLGEFTYSSVNSTATGTMFVTNPYVPDLPRPEDISIMFDFTRGSENSTVLGEKYELIYNWTVDNGFTVSKFDEEQIDAADLATIDLYIVLEPVKNYTDFEVADILSFVRGGKSMLIGGVADTAFTNIPDITKAFGFGFSNATARYINATIVGSPVGENNTLANFNITSFIDHPIITENQYVPLTDEIITKMQYQGPVLDFNASWALDNIPHTNLTDSDEVVDAYALVSGNETIFADFDGDITVDENETVGENNTLIAIAETTYNGRVLGFGSADIFNNTLIARDTGNIYMFQRSIQWLTKMYAVLQTTEFALDTYYAKIGENIGVTHAIYAQNETVVDNINITLNVWRNLKIEHSIFLSKINNTNFEGEIVTLGNLSTGTYSVQALAHKRGYGYNLTQSFYIEIDPKDPSKLDLPIVYVLTFVAAVGVGIAGMTLFFIRVIRTPKTEVEKEVKIEEDEEEIEEEVDLEEYESDESE
jgi:heme/copper-type cytochrome/quinol oxidase subunit 2